MGLSHWGVLFLFFAPFFSHAFETQYLRDTDAILKERCRVQTSPSGQTECDNIFNKNPLDVIPLPLHLATQVARQLEDAHSQNFFGELSKMDLFHGHFLAKGPQTTYSSPEDFFKDLKLILYHSHEYENEYWKDIKGEDPFVPHKRQRSFVGMFDNSGLVTAAIYLIDPNLYPKPYPEHFLRQYKTDGTIYMKDINDSLDISQHELKTFGRSPKLYLHSDPRVGKPCEVFSQFYILQQANGRFTSPNGKKYDMVLHCHYK